MFSVPFLLGGLFADFRFFNDRPLSLWIVLALLLPGGLIAAYVTLGFIEKAYWQLTDQHLIAGHARKKTYALNLVKQVVLVSPYLQRTPADEVARMGLVPFMTKYKYGLVLHFFDAVLLPVNLHAQHTVRNSWLS